MSKILMRPLSPGESTWARPIRRCAGQPCPQAQNLPHEPEVVSLRQPTPAGEFTGTLLPSVVATYQGPEGIGEAAQGNVVITVPASFQAAQLR